MATEPEAEVVPLVDSGELKRGPLSRGEAVHISSRGVSRKDVSYVGFGRNPLVGWEKVKGFWS